MPPSSSQPHHVGARIAKYFYPEDDDDEAGASPPTTSNNDDGSCLFFGTVSSYSKWWHIEYDDGDSEDMNAEGLRDALNLYRRHKRKDPQQQQEQQQTSAEEADSAVVLTHKTKQTMRLRRRITPSPELLEEARQELLVTSSSASSTAAAATTTKKSSTTNHKKKKHTAATKKEKELARQLLYDKNQQQQKQQEDNSSDDEFEFHGSDEEDEHEAAGTTTTRRTSVSRTKRRATGSRKRRQHRRVSNAADDDDHDEPIQEPAAQRQRTTTIFKPDNWDEELSSEDDRNEDWDAESEISATSQDEDDHVFEADEAFHRTELDDRVEEETAGRRGRRGSTSPLQENMPAQPAPLSQDQIDEMLAEIPNPSNQALQQLLIRAGFQFQLLPHQFLAVRKVAGVPAEFPLHKGSPLRAADNVVMDDETTMDVDDDGEQEEEMGPSLRPNATVTMEQAIVGLDSEEFKKQETKGVLIADEMGLGKTVEALAGAVLRNELAAAKKEKKRATVIVAPNDAVLIQWRDTLITGAGVAKERIQMFRKAQTNTGFDGCNFVLLTRHTLQAEIKELFDFAEESNNPPRTTSSLFPYADRDLLKRLRFQYLANKGKLGLGRKNEYKAEGETLDDCVSRLIRLCTIRMDRKEQVPIFETMIVDESHLVKNRATYWGIATALVCAHSRRRVPLTGTPYNNGHGDLAAMMTFIDPNKHAAYKRWWDTSTEEGASESIAKRVQLWRETFVVRRRKEEVLKDLLPPKHVTKDVVSSFGAEMSVYDYYEDRLERVLQEFRFYMDIGTDNPVAQMKRKEIFQILMALMSNMRSANIHAICPNGREYTKQFSPSRRHLLEMEKKVKSCICCNRTMRPSIPIPVEKDENGQEKPRNTKTSNRRARATADLQLEEGQENNDDADELLDDEEGDKPLVPLPSNLCQAAQTCQHYAHEECLAKLKTEGAKCPRCEHAKNTLNQKLPDGGTRYCTHINGGFTSSSKISAVVKWYHSIPKDDKVIIASFFKSGLDLLEGIFVEDFGIDCARFDGDLDRRTSQAELERFKSSSSCKVLFLTVQSGGVGLNIVEANHLCFLDRHYNPFVHDQCEARCHRLKQTKDVHITYFDCGGTIDQAMAHLNLIKQKNSAVLLADGFEIGNKQGLSYKDLSGMLGNLMAAIRSHRAEWFSKPENLHTPVPPYDVDRMEGVTNRVAERNLMNKKLAAAQQRIKSPSSTGKDVKPGAKSEVLDDASHGAKAIEDIDMILADTDDEGDTEDKK